MLTVSNYHYIRPNFEALYPSIFGITPSQFGEQLQLLKNEGEFIHPNDLLADTETILKSKDNFYLVTFDDGLKEQFDFALPVLDKLNIPAVFFANSINCEQEKVTTVHKIHLLRSILPPEFFLKKLAESEKNVLSEDQKRHAQEIYRYDTAVSAMLKYWLNFRMSFKELESFIDVIFKAHYDEREVLEKLYMNKENIITLAQQNYLGSHSHHHYPLGLLKPEEIHFELGHSKDYFENLTHTKIQMVSYPYGTDEACTDEVAAQAKSVGYQIGFTTNRGVNVSDHDRLRLQRFDCNDLKGGKNFK